MTLLIFLIFLSLSGSPVDTNGVLLVAAVEAGLGGDTSPCAFSSALRALRASRFSFCFIAAFDGPAVNVQNVLDQFPILNWTIV